MNAANISVIIPCRDGERFLVEAIESVLLQTVSVAEIIVVDDGSTDSTPEIAARYPQVRYFYQPGLGVSAARNLGLKASQGEYIIFLDHDDRLLPEAVELGLEAFRLYPDCGFVFGTCRNISENGLSQTAQRTILEQPYELPIYPNILKGNSVHPPARHLFQRSVFDTVGEFDRTLTVAEDYDMYLRVAAAFRGYCHNQTVVEYREHSVSASMTARPTQHLLASLKVLNKQKPFVFANREHTQAYHQGKQHWCRIYGRYLPYDVAYYLKKGQPTLALLAFYLAFRYNPQELNHYIAELLPKLFNKLSKCWGSSEWQKTAHVK